ncbi:MAG: AMP-binding protein [Myxococcales bacterium]|nr:AMP-binding protein [Polyangiaceae bacterium]MDW8250903.1 AMP-binding protein [Myxococcales bacterium]
MVQDDPISWQQAATEVPGQEALLWGPHRWDFRGFAGAVAVAGEELRTLGAGPRVAVALQAPNGFRALTLAAATLEIGATLVLLHPKLTGVETEALLSEARPAVVAREDGLVRRPGAAIFPERVGVVMFTSGTSGRPRGALLSREALAAAARASQENLPVHPGDRWLLCLPLCHIGGLSILLRCLLGRGAVVLAPRFRSGEVLALIEQHRPTLLSVVPTMLHRLLEEDQRGLLASLRAVLVGGAAAPPALLERCARQGVLTLTTYGLTEACSQVTTQRPRARGTTEPGVGFPLPGVKLRLVDEDGQEVAPGEVGYLQVRGPMVMDGYLGEPPLRGWLDTGDLGSLDSQGRLHVHARRTDLIITGGENVYPAEIEGWLTVQPGVAEAMVFGVPDPVWGQIVAAAVVPGPGFQLERLRGAAAEGLAVHKRPKRWAVVEALPLGSTGKPLRRLALEHFAERLV